MQEKELEVLRPIMDELHGKICAIQHEMARRWTDYTGRMSKAQEYTQQQITELQKQIGDLSNKRIATLNHSLLLYVASQPSCWQKYLGSSSNATNRILSR
jgi:hypothetical protein